MITPNPDLPERTERNLERAFDFFIGSEKPEPKKATVKQPKKEHSIFRPSRDPMNKLQSCKGCGLKSLPSDEIRHYDSCKYKSIL